jgi:hypothetical protein
VPPEQLSDFFEKVAHATRPGGRVFIVDEPASGSHLSGAAEADNQTRTLDDGRSFQIVKVYYDPAAIQELLRQRGFTSFEMVVGEYFFYLSGIRNSG